MCDSPEWLNGLSNPIVESYHPNKTGHASGYTPTVSPYVTGATVTATAAVHDKARALVRPAGPASSGPTPAADRQIAPEVVLAPDLTTAAARSAAARAGVDLGSRASIDAADRLWSARQAAEFARR